MTQYHFIKPKISDLGRMIKYYEVTRWKWPNPLKDVDINSAVQIINRANTFPDYYYLTFTEKSGIIRGITSANKSIDLFGNTYCVIDMLLGITDIDNLKKWANCDIYTHSETGIAYHKFCQRNNFKYVGDMWKWERNEKVDEAVK